MSELLRSRYSPTYSPTRGWYGDPGVIALLDAHERLEAAIAGTGDTAILTVNVLRWPDEERIAFARHLLGSEWKAPEHERLEAEHENLRGACTMALAERDAFCSLTTQATMELDRLEGLLRAWHAARGDDESEASKDLWAEAERLARTPA